MGAPEDWGSLFDGHKQGRSGLGWNRGEAGGNNRRDEPKLIGTTFSLSGDSAHNHAVVYWSGQNSSVSNHVVCLFLSLFSYIFWCFLHESSIRMNKVI